MSHPSSPQQHMINLSFVEPSSELGHHVSVLVKNCPPLDPNSTYCNLLQCTHFAATSCAVLTPNGELVGFVSGYLIPDRPNTLFIWQVAVSPSQRGSGLGQKMLSHILSRNICQNVEFLETTITQDNAPSTAMFTKLAGQLEDATITKSVFYDKDKHFMGLHESELLFRIGPFSTSNLRSSK